MSFSTENTNGYTEACIDWDCEFENFYLAAEILKNHFKVDFTLKLDDFDSLYWDFKYKNSILTIHYNIYLGISIYPAAFQKASPMDNENTTEIGALLYDKLLNKDWKELEINTSGSNGLVIYNAENSNGARISIEKGNSVFTVTFNVSGHVLHSHSADSEETAKKYCDGIKQRINKLFEHLALPEERKILFWKEKYERLLKELTEI